MYWHHTGFTAIAYAERANKALKLTGRTLPRRGDLGITLGFTCDIADVFDLNGLPPGMY